MFTHPGKSWTSCGCVQVVAATLAILLLAVPGGAFDITDINLLEALDLRSNNSPYPGVTVIKGHHKEFAYRLSDSRQSLIVPQDVYQKAADALHRTIEYTVAATFRQERQTAGSIISFSDENLVYLEIQLSSKKNELRLTYTTHVEDGHCAEQRESFSLRTLSDDQWHKLALSFSGNEVQVFFDCHSVYKKMIRFIPDRNFSASNIKLYVGQRNSASHFLFKGDIEDVRILPGTQGYLLQCPHLDSHCPTCGQFSHFQNSIEQLQQRLHELTERLIKAEQKVLELPHSCSCRSPCLVNGKAKYDGEYWEDDSCKNCTCTDGQIKCAPLTCPALKCTYPKPANISNRQCCPECQKNCFVFETDMEHGEVRDFGCMTCRCVEGSSVCQDQMCPELSCPESEQLVVDKSCCKFCPDEDYCSKGHACHTNATCLNLNTKYTCTCHPGFQGDGFHCDDIDECAQKGGVTGNHCHLNTNCVNTSGSYICECLPGYRRLDKFNCIEIDECASGQHSCHENADCINTQGSYHCRCKAGFGGDGYECEPVCSQTCLNGGQCVAPGVCACRVGFIGASCEQDLDECATGMHGCKNTSLCINMPGWYYCNCKPGYETQGANCIDIDECHHNTHSCHSTATCVNTEGHFECQCPLPEDDPSCRLSCIFEDNEIPNGGKVTPHNQPCKICTCDKGVISCEDKPCNCSDWQGTKKEDLCCPQCDPRQSCTHQELKHVVFKSGDQWIYRCQTCECLYGAFDCWKLECPPLTCDNPLPLQPGDCCPRCDDDPCNFFGLPLKNTTQGQPCTYKGHAIASGQTFNDPTNQCTTCACKDGQLCCNFGDSCAVDDSRRMGSLPDKSAPLRVLVDSIKASYDNLTSETTTETAQRLFSRANLTKATSSQTYIHIDSSTTRYDRGGVGGEQRHEPRSKQFSISSERMKFDRSGKRDSSKSAHKPVVGLVKLTAATRTTSAKSVVQSARATTIQTKTKLTTSSTTPTSPVDHQSQTRSSRSRG